jgi:hypothetical protein
MTIPQIKLPQRLDTVIDWALHCAAIVAVLVVLGLSTIVNGGTDIPTEVPPCPEEYKGGLRP